MTLSKLAARVVVVLLAGCVFVPASGTAGEDDVSSYVSLNRLKSSGADWEITRQDITPEAGHIRLQHDNWLMYFLHWRPLDSTNRDLSVSYVQHHLLNFWGPEMPFSLTDDTGTTTVAGHPAWYAGGTIGGGAIRTRFIVWNCEETNRQFTADCNINLSMGTVEKQLETQYDITAAICCHDGCTSPEDADLPQVHSSNEWNLQFATPASWRTLPFQASSWFPDGMSLTNGTLWTLMTDSDKLIDLRWIGHDEPVTVARLESLLNELLVDSVAAAKNPGVFSFLIDTGYTADGRVWVKGTLEWLQSYDGELLADERTFVASLWTNENRDFLMLASIIHMNEIWGRQIDLSPTRETTQRFISDEVIPAIVVY
ncbi:MAG: hypothetical protein KKA42_08155 [candidate division Zixibacteria bacterium]|nr:hypothetical protein [candidate division Zixibacteria bacterium]